MYTILKKGGQGYVANDEGIYIEYVCDNVSDVSTLPTGKESGGSDRPRPGSVAIVTAAAEIYVLSNAREWVQLIGE